MTRRRRLALRVAGLALLALAAVSTVIAIRPPSRDVRAGFRLEVVASGFQAPTLARFAPDGRLYVGEKSGRIYELDRVGDRTPRLVADLTTQVYNNADHGLLGMTVDPGFPERPFVYVSYTFNARIGEEAPLWPGTDGADECPDPPGLLRDGCVSSGRLSVLEVGGDGRFGPERVLVEDWCQQSNTHSVGDVAFGADGALYMSAGDGAAYAFMDYGQRGDPPNPCGDPPGGVGVAGAFPTSEGGALRAQDLRTEEDPVTLDGTVIRVDPRTGEALPDNPLAGHPDPNARRIVAYGLKQPYRIAVRPGTSEVWAGDVGHRQFEEVNRVASNDLPVENFGWPCYEGAERQHDFTPEIQVATFDMCKDLYGDEPGAVTDPYYAYYHEATLGSGDVCPIQGGSVSGLAFLVDGVYAGDFASALYMADGTRGCLWALPLDDEGLPDRERALFVVKHGFPVDLQAGPDGHVYFVDLLGGAVMRLVPEG